MTNLRGLFRNDGMNLLASGTQSGCQRRVAAELKSLPNHSGGEAHLLPTPLSLGKTILIAGTAYQCGTVRFGRDPKTSVLDGDCNAHDLDNLYVVDATFFVSSSAVKPALMIIVNALQVTIISYTGVRANQKGLPC